MKSSTISFSCLLASAGTKGAMIGDCVVVGVILGEKGLLYG